MFFGWISNPVCECERGLGKARRHAWAWGRGITWSWSYKQTSRPWQQADWPTALNSPLALDFAHARRLTPSSNVCDPKFRVFGLLNATTRSFRFSDPTYTCMHLRCAAYSLLFAPRCFFGHFLGPASMPLLNYDFDYRCAGLEIIWFLFSFCGMSSV